MSKKDISNNYKKLDQISHVLLRPTTYVGSNKLFTGDRWICSTEDNKISKIEISFIPSFLKIFDEVITNSVDENKREGSKLNQIKINIDDNLIIIYDNGGIPVKSHSEYKQWIPEIIFGELMSGSNYNDSEDRIVAGTNGLGIKLSNIFSKELKVETCDGINLYTQIFSNNMRDRTKPIIKKHTKNHTKITYKPDYEKFGMGGIDEMTMLVLKKRVIDLAGCNPNIKFYFNDVLISIKTFEDYIKYYTDTPMMCDDVKSNRWSIGISPSDSGFQQVSFVNSCETYDGGTHIDYILNQIISKLREFFLKKHKVDIKPSELKNHIFLFVNTTIINPSFSSQTKEKLITEVKDFGSTFEVSEKFIKKIISSEIVNLILDWVNQKKLADESKLARDLNKSLSKIKVDKLVDAKGKERWKCSLCLFEGDSAANGTRNCRDPQVIGSFALKGKFINVSEIQTSKLIQNTEAVNLMAAIGLKLGEKAERLKLRYGKIIIYGDQDFDGYSVTALLINFFNKYWPELFEYKVIYKAETPIVVITNIKNKKNVIKFYTHDSYSEWEKTANHKEWDISYKKGLSALSPVEYSDIINNPKLTLLTKDDISDHKLDIWFGGVKTIELRKNEILKND